MNPDPRLSAVWAPTRRFRWRRKVFRHDGRELARRVVLEQEFHSDRNEREWREVPTEAEEEVLEV